MLRFVLSIAELGKGDYATLKNDKSCSEIFFILFFSTTENFFFLVEGCLDNRGFTKRVLHSYILIIVFILVGLLSQNIELSQTSEHKMLLSTKSKPRFIYEGKEQHPSVQFIFLKNDVVPCLRKTCLFFGY